jgi:hypothetical protein
MTSILDTQYDRTTTQLLRDALKRSHEDARLVGFGLGRSEDGHPRSADPEDSHPQLKDWIRALDDRSRHNFALASSYLADLCSSLSALMRAGLVLSWLPDTATALTPTVTFEQEWEREEDWKRLFM